MSVSGVAAAVRSRVNLDPVIAGILAFFLVHMLIRIFGTSNFSVDDTEAAVHTQVFQLYYALRNPPLFDWLFFGLSRFTGVNVVTIQILKTALLIGAGIFVYLAVRPAFRHRAALEAAILAYGTTAFYGWDVFQQFSHSVPLIFAMAFTLWAFMRVVRLAGIWDYALLGVGLGLGILSKYLFGLYFVALIAAALRSPAYRRSLLSWRMLLTLIVGLIVVSPLLYGLSDAITAAFSTLTNRVAGSGSGPSLKTAGYTLLLTAEFWLPFVAILWLCLARWPAADRPASADQAPVPDESFYPLLRDATIIMVVVTFASVLLLGTRINGGRYLVAVLSLLPLAVFAAIDRRPSFPVLAVENFRRAAIVFIVAVAVIRFLIFLFVSPPFCLPRCVLFVDYRPVLEKIDTTSGKQNVILTEHVHLGANLLRIVPNARVVMDAYTSGSDLGIAEPADRNCYFIWFQRYRDANEQRLAAALRRSLGREPLPSELAAIGPPAFVTADWQTYLREWGRDTIIGVAKIDSSQRICEGGRIPGLSPPPNNNTMQ